MIEREIGIELHHSFSLGKLIFTLHSIRTSSLHVGHGLHCRHDVVRGLKVLHDAVLELLLLGGGQLVARVASLHGALAANGHHGVDELGVALHSDSLLVHV